LGFFKLSVRGMYLPYGEGKGLGSREGWPYNLGKAGTLGPREGSCLSGIGPWFHTRFGHIISI